MRFHVLLFAGVPCSKEEDGVWVSIVLVEVNHLFLLLCFTGEEGGEVAAGGDVPPREGLCLVAAL